VDPSVEFGLRFETHDEQDDDDTAVSTPEILPSPAISTPKDVDGQADGKDGKDAQIVSLDSFRK
jgi:uncharacterized protein